MSIWLAACLIHPAHTAPLILRATHRVLQIAPALQDQHEAKLVFVLSMAVLLTHPIQQVMYQAMCQVLHIPQAVLIAQVQPVSPALQGQLDHQMVFAWLMVAIHIHHHITARHLEVIPAIHSHLAKALEIMGMVPFRKHIQMAIQR